MDRHPRPPHPPPPPPRTRAARPPRQRQTHKAGSHTLRHKPLDQTGLNSGLNATGGAALLRTHPPLARPSPSLSSAHSHAYPCRPQFTNTKKPWPPHTLRTYTAQPNFIPRQLESTPTEQHPAHPPPWSAPSSHAPLPPQPQTIPVSTNLHNLTNTSHPTYPRPPARPPLLWPPRPAAHPPPHPLNPKNPPKNAQTPEHKATNSNDKPYITHSAIQTETNPTQIYQIIPLTYKKKPPFHKTQAPTPNPTITPPPIREIGGGIPT
jgi:hypothetical protein